MKLFTSKALCRFFVVCNLIMITTILPLYRLKDRKIGLEKKTERSTTLCRFFVVCNLIMITRILPLYRLKGRKTGLEWPNLG